MISTAAPDTATKSSSSADARTEVVGCYLLLALCSLLSELPSRQASSKQQIANSQWQTANRPNESGICHDGLQSFCRPSLFYGHMEGRTSAGANPGEMICAAYRLLSCHVLFPVSIHPT
jgi:hypothetical protein